MEFPLVPFDITYENSIAINSLNYTHCEIKNIIATLFQSTEYDEKNSLFKIRISSVIACTIECRMKKNKDVILVVKSSTDSKFQTSFWVCHIYKKISIAFNQNMQKKACWKPVNEKNDIEKIHLILQNIRDDPLSIKNNLQSIRDNSLRELATIMVSRMYNFRHALFQIGNNYRDTLSLLKFCLTVNECNQYLLPCVGVLSTTIRRCTFEVYPLAISCMMKFFYVDSHVRKTIFDIYRNNTAIRSIILNCL